MSRIAHYATPHLWGTLDYARPGRLQPDGDTIHARNPVVTMMGKLIRPEASFEEKDLQEHSSVKCERARIGLLQGRVNEDGGGNREPAGPRFGARAFDERAPNDGVSRAIRMKTAGSEIRGDEAQPKITRRHGELGTWWAPIGSEVV